MTDYSQAKIDKTSVSKLGVYFGFWKMGSKFSRAAALILAGNSLSWIGFEAQKPPNDEVSLRLALLFGPGVGIFLLLTAFLIYIGYKKGRLYA